jgi:thiol-disulfide isomerase/thioredoxin
MPNFSKRGPAIAALVVLLISVVLGYYYVVKSNSEGFFGDNGSEPSLKPSADECVVALFYADWCPHCVNFKPIFQKAKDTMTNKPCTASNLKGKKLRFEMVDCEACPALAKQYSVNGYPTVKLITGEGITEYSKGRDLDSMNNYFFPN